MSVLDKLKTAVRGNPVMREYELQRHIGSGGPSSLWKIYDGVKKSTRQNVSIFVYDKKAAEAEKVPKKEREAIVNLLKKGPVQLVKLRHPSLLTIEHGVEESRDVIAFASEPVVASVANLLGKYDNAPSPLPLAIKEYQLDPLEIKYGLLQVAEGLEFLHGGVKLIHGNLTPENIVINKAGAWKIFGFNFGVFINYQSGAQEKFAFHEWNSKLSFRTQPSLNYLAPEYVLNKTCDAASDLYTYGVLIHAVFNQGKPLFECDNNLLTYKHQAEQLSRVLPNSFFGIPESGREHVRMLLNLEPSVRPDASQMTKSPLFDDIAIVTLQYLDSLMQKDSLQKSQFFKTLHKVLPKLPKRVTLQRALPALCSEFRTPEMIPFVLPNVLFIAEDCNTDEYVRNVLPHLKPVFKVHEPIQVLLIFLQKMDLLLTKTPPDAIRSDVLPMIIRALASPSAQIQELCISVLPTFANMIDYSSMKHAILPKLKSLCLETNSLKVRINILVCLAKILDVLDKWMVLEEILPMLEAMPSKEPGVLMSMLGVLKACTDQKKLGFDKEILATRIIPFLFPLSVELTLNENQFKSFMSVIKDMIRKVETDHSVHLQQLGQMKEQTQSTVKLAQEVSEAKATDDMMGRLEKMMAQENPSPGTTNTNASPSVSAAKPASPLTDMDRLFATFDSTVLAPPPSSGNQSPIILKPSQSSTSESLLQSGSLQPTLQSTQQQQPKSQSVLQPTLQQPSQSQPALQPTSLSTLQPKGQPASFPTSQSMLQPITSQPILQPTSQQASLSTLQPKLQPASLPTLEATPSASQPALQPTVFQSTSQSMLQPSSQPILQTTVPPTSLSTLQPTLQPTPQSTLYSAPGSVSFSTASQSAFAAPTNIESQPPFLQPKSGAITEPTWSTFSAASQVPKPSSSPLFSQPASATASSALQPSKAPLPQSAPARTTTPQFSSASMMGAYSMSTSTAGLQSTPASFGSSATTFNQPSGLAKSDASSSQSSFSMPLGQPPSGVSPSLPFTSSSAQAASTWSSQLNPMSQSQRPPVSYNMPSMNPEQAPLRQFPTNASQPPMSSFQQQQQQQQQQHQRMPAAPLQPMPMGQPLQPMSMGQPLQPMSMGQPTQNSQPQPSQWNLGNASANWPSLQPLSQPQGVLQPTPASQPQGILQPASTSSSISLPAPGPNPFGSSSEDNLLF
ncbi:SCY1-like protein 2 [Oscarella lobularis]|uniref:SCY1-like protein 2 n=1 Tax=Oscarella lobularis TaxID=121494 RepID=UPI0033132F39